MEKVVGENSLTAANENYSFFLYGVVELLVGVLCLEFDALLTALMLQFQSIGSKWLLEKLLKDICLVDH